MTGLYIGIVSWNHIMGLYYPKAINYIFSPDPFLKNKNKNKQIQIRAMNEVCDVRVARPALAMLGQALRSLARHAKLLGHASPSWLGLAGLAWQAWPAWSGLAWPGLKKIRKESTNPDGGHPETPHVSPMYPSGTPQVPLRYPSGTPQVPPGTPQVPLRYPSGNPRYPHGRGSTPSWEGVDPPKKRDFQNAGRT